jgi:magnesium transporter
MDAFASIISNNLNVVMKVLTALTLLFAIPTAVASFFGMNVKLPLMGHEFAFEAAIVVSLVLVSLAALFFRRQRWL